jgi:putative tryptophan/tyrosine transport system substrate-binding protein
MSKQSSLPGLTPFTRLAALKNAELGQARVPMQSVTFAKTPAKRMDVRVKPAHDELGVPALMMQRREFITLLGGAAVASSLLWPVAVRAQQAEKMRRVGVLMGTEENDTDSQARIAAFREALRKLGWIEGRNIQIDIRWGEADAGRARAYAAELVGTAPQVLLGNGGPAVSDLRQETGTIPIVFVMIPDPVALGLVASLARPGGNITGFTHFELAMGGKWLEALKEISPRVSRVAFILPPEHPAWAGFLRTIQAAAPSFGVTVAPGGVHDAAEIERFITSFGREPNGGLLVLPSPVSTVHRDQIIALTARYRIPAIYPFRYFPASGGLMSYGVNPADEFRRAASYIDRILKGEKPVDLPVQAPTKYELVINLKTAKALGLDVPPTLLAIADEVIE